MFLLPIPAAVAAFNYFVDPACLFRNPVAEKEIASYLLKGNNVANFSNYNSRLIQRFYIEALQAKKDVIVLGSSRTMLIGRGLYPGKVFFNSSVDGATIEDIMAIYWMYRKNKFSPKLLIIGLDPWILNKNSGLNQFISIREEYMQAGNSIFARGEADNFRQDLGLRLKKYSDIFSPVYFQLSISVWLKNLFGIERMKKYYVTKNDVEYDTFVKLSDGAESFSAKDRKLGIDQVRALALTYANQLKAYGISDFKELNSSSKDQLRRFIELLQKDGVEILFFLCPYHPESYDIFVNSEKYKIIKDAESYFRDFAKKHRIKIIGSYNPHVCNLTDSDFYDGMHPKEYAIVGVFKEANYASNSNRYSDPQ